MSKCGLDECDMAAGCVYNCQYGLKFHFDEPIYYISLSHWGMFPITANEAARIVGASLGCLVDTDLIYLFSKD